MGLSNAGPDGIGTPRGASGMANKRVSLIRGKIGASEDVLSEIMRWSQWDRTRWEFRNQRFQRDQDLYQLKNQNVTAQIKNDVLILPDPKILVKKVARLIARHPGIIEVPAAPDADPVGAQKIENYLYLWDQACNQAWMMGLHHPYRYDQAFYSCLRGWDCERTLLRADPEDDPLDPMALWDHQVFDPANVYPFAAGGRVQRVTHFYYSTAGELKDDPLYAQEIEKAWQDVDDNVLVQITGTYWKAEAGWYHAVTVGGYQGRSPDSMWIKEPTELGYNPWTITLVNGSSYQQTPWDDLDYLQEAGTGILEDSVDTFAYLNRMATKLNELLSLEADPPASIYLEGGQPKAVSFRPHARNYFTPKAKVELHRIGPTPNDFQMLWDLLQQRAARAGLPPAFFAEYGGESGFSASVIMAAGKDILFPFTEAINQADALKYRKVLEIYRDHGPGKPLRTKMPPNAMGAVQSAEITAQDIKKQGTYCEVTREDMTPQEIATRVQIGLAQLREKAISLKRFRKEYAKIKNPDAENVDVLAEQVYLSDDVIKLLIPQALEATHQDYLSRLWELTQSPTPPIGTPPGNGPAEAPGGLPPGAPPMPPGAMPPPGGMPGLPPGAMPPLPGPLPGVPPGAAPMPMPMPGMMPPGMMPPGMMPPGMPMPMPPPPVPQGPPWLPPGVPPELLLAILSGQAGPGPTAPPMPMPGLPTQALPPIAGGNLLTNTQLSPEQAALEAALGGINGGALGGMGAGGLPPVPGTTSPIERPQPPGRGAPGGRRPGGRRR